ncbi:MAG: carbohydrate ABC transporter permease [Chloroflexota bacterium]
MKSSYRILTWITNFLAYAVLAAFAYLMLFPFLYMFSTSLKYQTDTFRYPPRLMPMQPISAQVEGFDEPLPLYDVTLDDGQVKQYALAESNIKIGIYAQPNNLEVTYQSPLSQARPVGGATNQQTVNVNGKNEKLFEITVDNQDLQVIKVDQTALGRFVNPNDPKQFVLRNVRLTPAVEQPTLRPVNYQEVVDLQGLDRSLTNTALVTILVVIGQLTTSVLGGYALARLRFPGRDQLFVIYLGTIMIPFVVLITPLYQLMVAIGWVNKLAALVIPWIFTAYGTFLMRQFFITIPKEIEEAALIDGASRFQILTRIFLPASVPALATLATFTFLYAWNSFFWPLVIINTGNRANHVLTLSLSILRGRASDNANLVMAGAAIAVLPPMIVYILAQRFFVESAVSSGVKG